MMSTAVTNTLMGLSIQPGRFTHVVDRVESSTEGSGVPGGGPERTEDTGQQHPLRHGRR